MSGKPRCTVCGRMMVWYGAALGWVCPCEEQGLLDTDDYGACDCGCQG